MLISLEELTVMLMMMMGDYFDLKKFEVSVGREKTEIIGLTGKSIEVLEVLQSPQSRGMGLNVRYFVATCLP